MSLSDFVLSLSTQKSKKKSAKTTTVDEVVKVHIDGTFGGATYLYGEKIFKGTSPQIYFTVTVSKKGEVFTIWDTEYNSRKPQYKGTDKQLALDTWKLQTKHSVLQLHGSGKGIRHIVADVSEEILADKYCNPKVMGTNLYHRASSSSQQYWEGCTSSGYAVQLKKLLVVSDTTSNLVYSYSARVCRSGKLVEGFEAVSLSSLTRLVNSWLVAQRDLVESAQKIAASDVFL